MADRGALDAILARRRRARPRAGARRSWRPCGTPSASRPVAGPPLRSAGPDPP